MRFLLKIAFVAALSGCNAQGGAEPAKIVDVTIADPAWEARNNFPVSHPWPAADLNGLPAGRVFNALSKDERVRVQAGLARTGVFHGKTDGVWGAQTWNAVRAWSSRTGQSALLLDEKGSLDIFRGIAG